MKPRVAQIVEVGPRDGLQYEAVLPYQDKVNFIHALSKTGLTHIESGSFVSKKWVPQMADSDKVFSHLEREKNITYSALTPNQQGFERALKANVDEIAIFASASESFSEKNLNCSIAKSLKKFEPVIELAQQHKINVRGYVSCALGCPYEDKVMPSAVAKLAQELYQMGCYQISLGDTIGIGTADQARFLVETVCSNLPIPAVALHFHDTYGQALSNILACLDLGVHTFDSSVAGLGGCPYAKGASGNLATEDLVYFLHGQNIKTGVKLEPLIEAGHQICMRLNRQNQSKVPTAYLKKRENHESVS